MRNITCAVALWLLIAPASTWTQEVTSEEMRSLDEQVQEVKTDVLDIAAELHRLEERLLFPSDTQLGLFVSMAEGGEFRLDAVQVRINGELVAHYIYSYKELEALQKGGVQRLYTGNIRTGQHALEVSINGQLHNGRDFEQTERFGFHKDVEPKLLAIALAAQGGGTASIELSHW